jgi:hypothetical protein
MAVVNGQDANENTFNNAFLSRTVDSSTIALVDLENTDPSSGDTIQNIQRELNKLNDVLGSTPNDPVGFGYSWVSNDVGVSTDSVGERADLLTEKFGATGHTHTGASGEGGQIESQSLINTPLKGYEIQGVDKTGVTGSSIVVTSDFSTKSPSTNSTTLGVVVNSAQNKIVIRYASGATQDDSIVSLAGDVVYGRLTFSAGVWLLSFYTNISGTETAFSFATVTNVRYYYQELFNPLNSASPPPVYSTFASIPSDNITSEIQDASATQRGVVTTGTQTFGGIKTFQDQASFSELVELVKEIVATQISTPSAPGAGKRKLYPKSDGWYELDSGGLEKKFQTGIGAGGGGAAPNIILLNTVGPGTYIPTVGTTWFKVRLWGGGGGGAGNIAGGGFGTNGTQTVFYTSIAGGGGGGAEYRGAGGGTPSVCDVGIMGECGQSSMGNSTPYTTQQYGCSGGGAGGGNGAYNGGGNGANGLGINGGGGGSGGSSSGFIPGGGGGAGAYGEKIFSSPLLSSYTFAVGGGGVGGGGGGAINVGSGGSGAQGSIIIEEYS